MSENLSKYTELTQQLHTALHEGKDQTAIDLIGTLPYVNTQLGEDLLTPLYMACDYKRSKVVTYLLTQDANKNLPSKQGWTALHIASQNGLTFIALRLLGKHLFLLPAKKTNKSPIAILREKQFQTGVAHVNAQSNTGKTPLSLATQYGHLAMMAALLENGAAPDIANQDNITPLWVAADQEDATAVQMLLDYAADPNICPKNGGTPLQNAVRKNHLSVISSLLIIKSAEHQKSVNAEDKNTALYFAAALGNEEAAILLFEHGASLSAQYNHGATAIFAAAKRGHEKLLRKLLLHRQVKMETLKSEGNVEEYELLQRSIDVPLHDGTSPLLAALENERIEIAMLLLEHSASTECKRKDRLQPIHLVAAKPFKTHGEIARMLVACGANLCAITEAGQTPMVVANKCVNKRMWAFFRDRWSPPTLRLTGNRTLFRKHHAVPTLPTRQLRVNLGKHPHSSIQLPALAQSTPQSPPRSEEGADDSLDRSTQTMLLS